MSRGRAEGVLCNSSHEASSNYVPKIVVGVCDGWDTVFHHGFLPWSHSILEESRVASPFKAANDALSLHWEECADCLRDGVSILKPPRHPLLSLSPNCRLSQRPHSDTFSRKQVCFEDPIDVFFGDDDTLDMSHIAVAQSALLNWATKPWSKKRIRKYTYHDVNHAKPLLPGTAV